MFSLISAWKKDGANKQDAAHYDVTQMLKILWTLRFDWNFSKYFKVILATDAWNCSQMISLDFADKKQHWFRWFYGAVSV